MYPSIHPDKFQSGRPKTATTDDNITKVESMIRNDCRITQNEIAIALNILQGAVSTIFQNLGFKKYARGRYRGY